MKRPDYAYHVNGVEIGAAEIKPVGFTELEKCQDLIKLAHHLKNQADHLIEVFDIPEEDEVKVL
ncbi:hypothetical protein HK096_007033, partial [Nowakowskiella sp. JEL0078]